MILKRLALGAAVFSLVVGCATFTALGDGQYSGYPAYGDYHWRAPVATTAKLPSSGNFTGDARLVFSPISVYYWTGSAWLSLIPASVVSGVVSATDNALVRWDGTTGTAIQNSTATLSDTGLLSTSNLLVSGLTASTVPYLDASKQLTSSVVTPTQLGYLDATSSIQTQLDGKQANGNYITALTGDVTASGPGSSAATVANVGGKTASAVSGSVDATSAATSANTASTIVKRDASGNFSAGTITANLTGNASGSAASFTGSLSGDVAGTQSATVVSSVGGKTASAVATSTSATEAATNSNTASTIVKRDASGNFSAGTISAALTGNASTATALAANPTDCAAGNMATTIDANGNLTCAQVSDSYIASGAAISRSKIASGTANHVVINDSSGNLSSVAPSTSGNVLTSDGTVWKSSALFANQNAGTYLGGPYSGSAAAPTFKAFQAMTVQKFTSGSGTYTTPAGVLYIRVRMVGGGGGGGGSGTGSPGNGGAGGNTTFGSSLLSTTGGGGGGGTNTGGNALVGAGGGASLGTGPIGIALSGGAGGLGAGAVANAIGGAGAPSAFGGAGLPGWSSGQSGVVNTGGGGAGYNGAATFNAGNGGGAGGFVDAIITSPSATYSYAVGAGGSAGAAGTGGAAGGAGGSGLIVVEEHYQ